MLRVSSNQRFHPVTWNRESNKQSWSNIKSFGRIATHDPRLDQHPHRFLKDGMRIAEKSRKQFNEAKVHLPIQTQKPLTFPSENSRSATVLQGQPHQTSPLRKSSPLLFLRERPRHHSLSQPRTQDSHLPSYQPLTKRLQTRVKENPRAHYQEWNPLQNRHGSNTPGNILTKFPP